jgi:hypothetical protein
VWVCFGHIFIIFLSFEAESVELLLNIDICLQQQNGYFICGYNLQVCCLTMLSVN